MSTDRDGEGWGVARGSAGTLPPVTSRSRRWPRGAVVTTLVLAALIVGLAGVLLATLFGGDDESAAGDDGAPAVVAASTEPDGTPSASPAPTATPSDPGIAPSPTPTSGPTSTPSASPSPSPTPTPAAASPDDEPVRTAVLRGGQVFLGGRVPSAEVADEIAGKVARVVGPDNVVVEYEVDPTAPVPDSAPLVVEDRVLFDVGSAEVREDFLPILELGVDLLTRFPDATLTVVGHTDSTGSAASNLVLSQERVASVTRYLVDRGVPPAQVLGQARGEDDLLVEEATDADLAANRRAEFVVTGLLDP